MRCRLVGTLVVVALAAGARPVLAGESGYERRDSRDRALLLGGVGMEVAAFLVDRSLDPLSADRVAELDPADVNAFDRPATRRWSSGSARTSDVVLGAVAVAPLGLLLSDPGRDDPWTVASMYAETLLLTHAATTLAKVTIRRTRPYAYNGDPDIPAALRTGKDARRSFPSGHASLAFAAAVFLGTTHGRLHPHSGARPWVWAGGLAGASAVSWLRYDAGKHFPTDLLAGAALGSAVGWLVPELHEHTPGMTLSAGPETLVAIRVAF